MHVKIIQQIIDNINKTHDYNLVINGNYQPWILYTIPFPTTRHNRINVIAQIEKTHIIIRPYITAEHIYYSDPDFKTKFTTELHNVINHFLSGNYYRAGNNHK